MQRKTTIEQQTGTEQGTVWHWQIKEGREVIAGGYCRTKKDATNDAALADAGRLAPRGQRERTSRSSRRPPSHIHVIPEK
jgi:hypothetical protein